MKNNGWQRDTSLFLIGIGVGAGLGMLFAPKSGEETREDIAAGIRDGVDGVIAKGNKVSRRAQRSFEEAKEQLQDAVEAGEQAYRTAKVAS